MIILTMLYNNIVHDNRLVTGWGMACLIEGMEKTILFDTGGDGKILLSNMRILGKTPGMVDVVVLSHGHGDHTGGLGGGFSGQAEMGSYISPDHFLRRSKKTPVKSALK